LNLRLRRHNPPSESPERVATTVSVEVLITETVLLLKFVT